MRCLKPPPRIFAALAIASAACAAPARTPAPPPVPRDIRAVPATFIEESVARRKASGLTFRAYNTGVIRTRGGAVSSIKSWSAKIKLDVPVFLVKHPSEGYVLFDTGMSTATARTLGAGLLTKLFVRFETKPGQDILSQLRADGVDPAEVKWVVLSHLHLDHTGLAEAFPRATVAVSRKEWETGRAKQALKPDPSALPVAKAEKRLRIRLVDFEGVEPLGAFDRAVDFFSDGTVFLVDLPGHTPGSMGAWVNLDAGPVLMTGDAAWVIDNYLDLALPVERSISNLSDYWRSLHMIRAMQAAVPRLVILPGHDLMPRLLANRDDLPLVPFPKSEN